MEKAFNQVQRAFARLYLSKNIVLRGMASLGYTIAFFGWRMLNLKMPEQKEAFRILGNRDAALASLGIRWQIFWWYLWHGFEPCEFVAYHFERKSRTERLRFWPRVCNYKFVCVLNDRMAAAVLRDKEKTCKLFRDCCGREVIKVRGDHDADLFLDFASRHHDYFLKPVDSHGGDGVSRRSCQLGKENDALSDVLARSPCVVEEVINQCDELNGFNRTSVNTIRIATLLRGNDVSVLFAVMRCGRNGAVVDNSTAGGLFAIIDATTGVVYSDGMIRNTADVFEKHPESGLQFKGFAIPRWTELVQASFGCARKLPAVPYVSWDWAVTNDGIALVEANASGGMTYEQAMFDRGMRAQYEKILLSYD